MDESEWDGRGDGDNQNVRRRMAATQWQMLGDGKSVGSMVLEC